MKQIQSRWRLLIAAVAFTTAWPGLIGAPALARSAPTDAWITAAATELRTAHGEGWLRARDAAMARPEFEAKALVSWLDSPARSPEERTAARILRARLELPDVAAVFDTAVAKSVSDPVIGHSGDPKYSATMPGANAASGPFSIELLWKRTDLPAPLRKVSFDRFMADADYVEPMLVILGENPSWGGSIVRVLGRMAKAHPDPRVVPALLANYRYFRANKPDDAGTPQLVMAWTARLATPEAAAAVLEMRDIERASMQARGLAPWDDQEAEEALKQADLARAEASRHELEPGGQERIAEAKLRVDEAAQRKWRRWLWEQIEATVVELRAKGLIADDQ